jgi:hypothetical protein
MAMAFEELDATTRAHMLEELEKELEGAAPYLSRALSKTGQPAFPSLLREAVRTGTEESLAQALTNAALWNATEAYVRNGVSHERALNVSQATARLALTEFNTWYVRGLAARLMKEGVERCQAYRAAEPKWEPSDCSAHEGHVYLVADIYRWHRARYWPKVDPTATSIPFGPGCHHTIRRYAQTSV